MKRLYLFLLTLLLLSLLACRAQQDDPVGTAAVGPTATTAPAATVTSPAMSATATVQPAPTPTEEATIPAPTATTTTPEPTTGGFLCPDVDRPALAFLKPGEGHLIANPISGKSCTPVLAEEVALFQASGDAIYYTVRENEQFVVKRLREGESEVLPYTAVPVSEAEAYHSFIVSPDGTMLAWAAAKPDGTATISQIWLAETTNGDVWTPLPPYRDEGNGSRTVQVPIRFAEDNSTLYYTHQPYGIGGSWIAFDGRYDNLYALRLRSEAPPELLFDCGPLGELLCLGDFYVAGDQLLSLAYVDGESNVVVENGTGDVVNALEVSASYVAYPTFGPGGELVFYGAEIEDTSGPPQPSSATIYRVAPPTAPAEALAQAPNLLPPQAWLDATHVVVGYVQDEQWGTAVVDLNGAVEFVPGSTGASFAAILPAGPSAAQAELDDAIAYVDDFAGVTLLHPAGWSVLDVDAATKADSMAYAVTFQSWQPQAGGQGGIPEGATKFDLVVIADTEARSLEEAIAERKAQMAEMEPAEEILAEERVQLSGNLEAVRWLVSSRGEQAVVYLTFVDGRMIMVSGLGDFQLVDAVARTLEPVAG